jgi:acylphosphatase
MASARPAIRLVVAGRVQGVGYRWWAIQRARALGLDGWVRNRRDGSVEALVIGRAERLQAMVAACRQGPSAARVTSVVQSPAEDDASTGFDDRPTV